MIRAALLALLPCAALAEPICKDITFDALSFTTCTVDLTQDRLELFLNQPNGTPLGSFGAVDKSLKPRGETLSFAMNAGMYHADRSPVGLYVEHGLETQQLVTTPGPGNFGLVPNGVFCVSPKHAKVMETRRFERKTPNCDFATQSGPMLVIDGALHPRFLKNSSSRYVRNGVGTSADGKTAIFAISNQRVTFHEFGRLFRDGLKLPQALYFDGNISRLYAPSLGRADPGFTMGPMVGAVVPR